MTKIVVGTDGSLYATTAMRWAAEEAELHRSTLEAVLAWSYLDQHHPDHSDAFDAGYTEENARAALSAWVKETLGADAIVHQRVIGDLPVQALLEASDAADLLVLGARGTGGFEGLLLGSVSERVAQLATRPVAVVRAKAPVQGGRVVVGVDGLGPVSHRSAVGGRRGPHPGRRPRRRARLATADDGCGAGRGGAPRLPHARGQQPRCPRRRTGRPRTHRFAGPPVLRP